MGSAVSLFVLLVFLITFFLTIWNLIKNFTFESAWMVVVAAGRPGGALKIRTYSLRQQDRIIRLEERLRLAALLPEYVTREIPMLDESQLTPCALPPTLKSRHWSRKTLAGNLKGAEIKKAIVNWRPDNWRI